LKILKLRGAEFIVRILEKLEAEYLFAYPGGAILPIYDALTETKLNTVLVRHEQAASFAAQGFARTRVNKPGFCLATSGPGATNLVTGIADAYADSIPMVALTGQVASNLIGSDAFQETDITGICAPITKKTYILHRLEDAIAVFQEAYSISINGRQGPVLIDIPKDVQNAEIEISEDWESTFEIPVHKGVFNVHPQAIDKAMDLMYAAKKPLIIAGHGILLADAVKDLRTFVKQEHIPAISTILGIGALEHDNPLYFSWLGMHGMKYANDAVQESDLIIALGIRFDDRITGKLSTFAPNAKIIHVDIDESEGSKNVPTNVFIHADLRTLLKGMPSTITSTNKVWRERWVKILEEKREKYPLKERDNRFTMVSCLDILNEQSDKNLIVATDVGQHQMWASQYLKKLEPHHYLTSGGLGSMGFGLPAAMGAQAANPGKEVWCISGDGSFLMNVQEMITLVQEGWPIKILLLDNTYLGMVRQWQEQFYSKNYSGVDLINPDFLKLAEAYNIEAVGVDNVEDYQKAVQKAKTHNGPFLIHARVLKEDNVFPMVPPQASLSDTMYYPEQNNRSKSNDNESKESLAHKM
jgi:acetolactate synthase-1/2/3 large subunit